MKITQTILSALLALPFFVFGLNYFFNFIPMPPMEGDPGTYIGILYSSGFLAVVKVLEVVLAIAIGFNILRPLALLLIAPIAINILMFEVFIVKSPGIGVLLVVLTAVLIYFNKEKYLSILK